MNPSIPSTIPCLLAFGSNQGDSNEVLESVLLQLRQLGLTSVEVGRPVTTKPVGGPAGQGDYLNACFRFGTVLGPEQLFELLVSIEQQCGRQRTRRWGSRTVDLDLLLYGQQQVFDVASGLIVPHPRMTFRRFVLEPATELAAEMIHPVAKMSLGDLLGHINAAPDRIRMVAGPDCSAEQQVVAAVCEEAGWEYTSAGDELDESVAKLNVYMEADSKAAEGDLVGRGPLLKLKAGDLEGVRVEIQAAIDALMTY